VIRPHLAQEELDARESFSKGTQNGREGFVGGRRYEAQGQSTDLTVADTLNREDGLIQLREHAPYFLQQQLTGLGQPYTSVRPLEQLHTEFLFQLLDVIAQRRLGEVQPFGRATEA